MTMDEFIAKRKAQFEKIIKDNVPLRKAVLDISAEQTQRIFIRGLNSANGQIGQYNSTKPIHVYPSAESLPPSGKGTLSPVKFTPKGKSGKTTAKDGRPLLTGYFESYKAFRGKIGRKVDYVNLSLSNDLQSDFSSKGAGAHNPERISAHEYHITLKRPLNVKKLSGNEKRFGEISKLTTGEKKRFFETINKETAAIFNA